MTEEEMIQRAEVFSKRYYDQYQQDPNLWENHIQLVRKYAIELCEIEKTDKFCLELAAILHDIGKYRGRKNHHLRSYRLSRKFLSTIDIPRSSKRTILECVLKHRTQFSSTEQNLQIRVIQAADVLGTLFDDEWQEYSRKTMKKEVLERLYVKALNKISLQSAQKIAAEQIEQLQLQIVE